MTVATIWFVPASGAGAAVTAADAVVAGGITALTCRLTSLPADCNRASGAEGAVVVFCGSPLRFGGVGAVKFMGGVTPDVVG